MHRGSILKGCEMRFFRPILIRLRSVSVSEVRVAGQSRSLLADLTGASKKDILKLAETHGVRFLRLTFTDILGVNKNVEIPSSQFSKALDGDIMFDGSSIEGFVRIEESDMLLSPDLSTFKVFPGGDPQSRVGRLICDITTPEGAAVRRRPARGASPAGRDARRSSATR